MSFAASRAFLFLICRLQFALSLIVAACGWAPLYCGLFPGVFGALLSLLAIVHTRSDQAVLHSTFIFKPMTAFFVVSHCEIFSVVASLTAIGASGYSLFEPLYRGTVPFACTLACIGGSVFSIITAIWIRCTLKEVVHAVYFQAAMNNIRSTGTNHQNQQPYPSNNALGQQQFAVSPIASAAPPLPSRDAIFSANASPHPPQLSADASGLLSSSHSNAAAATTPSSGSAAIQFLHSPKQFGGLMTLDERRSVTNETDGILLAEGTNNTPKTSSMMRTRNALVALPQVQHPQLRQRRRVRMSYESDDELEDDADNNELLRV